MTKITDWKIRKLSPSTRRELFSYIPRHRLTGMDSEILETILRVYGRKDLLKKLKQIV